MFNMKTEKQIHSNEFSIKSLLISASLMLLASCVPGIKTPSTSINVQSQISKVSVSGVSIENNQLIINGSNLNLVKKIWVKGTGFDSRFVVESSSSSKITSNGLQLTSFVMGTLYNLVLSDAFGDATFPIQFTLTDNSVTTAKILNSNVTTDKLADSAITTVKITDSAITAAKLASGSVTAAKLSISGAASGQYLKFNGTSWVSAYINNESQTYKGLWDPTTQVIPTVGAAGDYWLVSVAGTYIGNGIAYVVGDWIISDGTQWDKIPFSGGHVTSFNGRKGVITLIPADYATLKTAGKIPLSSLNDLSDVNITSPSGKVLKFDNVTSKWVPDDVATIVNAGATKIDATKIGSGNINNTKLDYLAAVTSDIQTQLNALSTGKQDAGSYQASGNYITALTGDVTASGAGSAAATVASVGGSSAASINTAVTTVTAATNTNTFATLVKRDGSGGFSAGAISVGTINSSAITTTGLTSSGAISATGLTSSSGLSVSSGNLSVNSGNVTVSGSVTASSFIGPITGNATNVTGVVDVPNGGTGVSSLTAGALLYGNAGNAINALPLPGASPRVLMSNITTGYPVWQTALAGEFIKGSVTGVVVGSIDPTDLPTSSVRGTGTANYIPYVSAISPMTIAASPVSINGSNIGVGVASPLYPMHVVGSGNHVSLFTSGSIAETSFDISNTSTGGKLYNLVAGGQTPTMSVPTGAFAIRDGTVGSVRMLIDTSGNVGIGTTSPQTAFQVAGVISPATDITNTLGSASYRFTTVYAQTGVINTSDVRQKKNIKESDLGLEFVNKLRPVSYNWKKGADINLHYGLIAQETEKTVLDFHTITNKEETPIVDYDKDSDRYGIRYTELISPIIKAIQEFFHRWSDDSSAIHRDIAAIKKENEALKAKIVKAEKENAEMKLRLDRIEKALKTK